MNIVDMVALDNEVICALPQQGKTITARIVAISPNLQQIKVENVYTGDKLILPVAYVLRLIRKGGLHPGVTVVVLSRKFHKWVNATVLAVSPHGDLVKVMYRDKSYEIIPRKYTAWLNISPYIKNQRPSLENKPTVVRPSNIPNGRFFE